MGIQIADNFSYNGTKPLDNRIKFATVSEMVSTSAASIYDGILVYVTGTKKYYTYDSGNEVIETLGKWREFQSGGSGGGGHTIQDDGVDMTARDNLNFVGMEVDDNSDDESTDVAEHRLTSAEISEMMGGIPNPTPRYPILFDERGTEYKVGWYILSNGTKKPVYERDFLTTLPNSNTLVDMFSASDHIEKCHFVEGYFDDGNGYNVPIDRQDSGNYQVDISVKDDGTKIYFGVGTGAKGKSVKLKLHYTKTTDTPV